MPNLKSMQPTRQHRRALGAQWKITSFRKGSFQLRTCVGVAHAPECRAGRGLRRGIPPGAGVTGRYESLSSSTATERGTELRSSEGQQARLRAKLSLHPPICFQNILIT